MSESIYYQHRHQLGDALLQSLNVLGVCPGDGASYGGIMLPQDEVMPETSHEVPEDIGEFFSDETMPEIRKLAIARVAAIVATRHVVAKSDLASIGGMTTHMLGYATGFLSNNLSALYNTYAPQPRHQLIDSLRGKSTTKRYFGSTELLLTMVESAEEKYPLLHKAIQEVS